MNIQLPHNWNARHYQREFTQYMYEGGTFPERKRAYLVWHRRAGKDSTIINSFAVSSQMRVGTYWHMLPTLNQGRKVVWNGIDGQGRRLILQAFPRELIENINEQEMLIKLRNGAMYQVVGSDNYNSLVGSNPIGVAFSEWALADPNAWNFVRPILAENGGYAAFITTPRGKNHAHTLYRTAEASDRWLASTKTVLDTHRDDGSPVIRPEDIEAEREEGVEEEIIQQEYYCSWEGVNRGSVYGRLLLKYADHQRPYEYDPELPVYSSWDIGHRDATAVWLFQIIGDEIHIIDYLEGSQMDADQWLEELENLPYAFGVPALPHDAKAKTFASSKTTYMRFAEKKFQPYIVPNVSVAQGIQAVRAILKNVYFNTTPVKVRHDSVRKGVPFGLERLMSYAYEWDDKLKVFTQQPLHDHNSHAADSFRMLAMSWDVLRRHSQSRPRTRRQPGDLGKHEMMTSMGRAINLESLFAERDAARQNKYPRIA